MKIDLDELIREAKKNYRNASKRFAQFDNAEDMHEEECWSTVVDWLEKKKRIA